MAVGLNRGVKTGVKSGYRHIGLSNTRRLPCRSAWISSEHSNAQIGVSGRQKRPNSLTAKCRHPVQPSISSRRSSNSSHSVSAASSAASAVDNPSPAFAKAAGSRA